MDHSPAPNALNTSNVATSSFTIKLPMAISRFYCPTEIMWANVLTKPKQGGSFCLARSHLTNLPINYDNNTNCLETNPFLLPLDECPLCPNQIKDQLPKDTNHSFQECVGDFISQSHKTCSWDFSYAYHGEIMALSVQVVLVALRHIGAQGA